MPSSFQYFPSKASLEFHQLLFRCIHLSVIYIYCKVKVNILECCRYILFILQLTIMLSFSKTARGTKTKNNNPVITAKKMFK